MLHFLLAGPAPGRLREHRGDSANRFSSVQHKRGLLPRRARRSGVEKRELEPSRLNENLDLRRFNTKNGGDLASHNSKSVDFLDDFCFSVK